MEAISGHTIFCDSIRLEVGGKYTFVGCYTGEMKFEGPAPGVLATFGAYITVKMPSDFEAEKITISVTMLRKDGELELFKAETPMAFDRSRFATQIDLPESDIEKVIVLSVPAQWTGLYLDAPGLIRVKASFDDVLQIKCGALRVLFAEYPPPE
jgi:hypothetical protein